MTTRWKTAVIAAVAAATVTAAMSAWAGRGGDESASAQEDTVPDTTEGSDSGTADDVAGRTISVSGTGTVEVTPDIATIWMGVQSTAATSQEALDQVAEDSQTLVDALKGLGIAEKDIQTSGLSLYPQYDNTGQQINGYQASVSVTLIARELDRLGEVIDGVSGFIEDNLTLGGISFSYDDPESVLANARADAIANARVRAAEYADAAGTEVGGIVKIAEASAMADPLIYAGGDMAVAADEGARVAIEPGSQELTVDVTVVFEMS